MAQRAVHLDKETISCSICLNLLKDPVTIPCGHNYCFSCIKDRWGGEDGKGIHSCPQCRKQFIPRPELLKNTIVATLVEELKKTGLQDAPADHCYAGAEDVACDVCTGRKLKALKSCLVCLVSFCENHLQPHHYVAQYKKHQLVDPSKNLQENVCSLHDEVMKMFCRSDQQCICSLCPVDEHKSHDIVSAAAERRRKQEELQESRQNIQQRIQDREEDVKVLQQEVKDINLSADEAVEHSQKIYTELIRLMEKIRSDVKEQIRSQQEAEVSRVQELQKKLEQEITELRSKDAELQQLSNTEDHCHFLHNYPSASQLCGSTHSSSIHIRPRRYFEDVTAAVSENREKLQELLRSAWPNVSLTEVDVLLSAEPEPKTRAEFFRYSSDVTLDPNTANTQLVLSKKKKRATWTKKRRSYPDHPERFIYNFQVLSRESLTGRHYWEVKWRGGRGGVCIAVAYKNISRGVYGSGFGYNDISWALYGNNLSYGFVHNNVLCPLSVPRSSRVGVYLDHPAGVVSFYSISDTMNLLHRVQTSFTQPLHVGLWVWDGDAFAELVKLE